MLEQRWLPSESSKGPVLFQQVLLLGELDAAGTLLARIDFQLGTNEAHPTGKKQRVQASLLFSREADQYVCSLPSCEVG